VDRTPRLDTVHKRIRSATKLAACEANRKIPQATVIAKTARELGILTIGIVTKPFHFEGQRVRFAEAGIAELIDAVDTLLVISSQTCFRVTNEKTT
jgi:hypothetical protein